MYGIGTKCNNTNCIVKYWSSHTHFEDGLKWKNGIHQNLTFITRYLVQIQYAAVVDSNPELFLIKRKYNKARKSVSSSDLLLSCKIILSSSHFPFLYCSIGL